MIEIEITQGKDTLKTRTIIKGTGAEVMNELIAGVEGEVIGTIGAIKILEGMEEGEKGKTEAETPQVIKDILNKKREETSHDKNKD